MPDIEIQSHDGGSFQAYIAYPEKTPAMAVIMIQEIFGINQEMRDKCDHMASLGYIALAPDLFWRIEPGIELVDSKPDELERAFELFGTFDQDMGLKDLESTMHKIRGHEYCNGAVACVGYCLGGKMAYRMAAETDIDASVSYYGVGIESMLDKANNIAKPLLMHIAEKDEFVPPDAQTKIHDKFSNTDHISVYSYEGQDHAFARGQGMHYDAEAAKLANDRTENFLKELA